MLHEQLLPEVKNYVNEPKFREALGIPAGVIVEVRFLAQGEYNLNYLLHLKGAGQEGNSGEKRYVFRVNTGSQMNLANQIYYEYRVLELLKDSGVTPLPFYVDDSRRELPFGCLVMEYLPGEPLDYHRDLRESAGVFARIHSLPLAKEQTAFLITVDGPFSVICDEVERLVRPYLECPRGNPEVKKLLEKLLQLSHDKRQEERYFAREPWRAVINTEVNSHNFIVNRERNTCHLIDWEKPIYGEPAQDLSMFLIPTTTLWKRDVILTREQEEFFINSYLEQLPPCPESKTLRDRIESFTFFNLLRAVSWCAMAWTEYTKPGRPLTNPDTFEKIEMYLEVDFIKNSFARILE